MHISIIEFKFSRACQTPTRKLSECLDSGKHPTFARLVFCAWVPSTIDKTHKPFFSAKFLRLSKQPAKPTHPAKPTKSESSTARFDYSSDWQQVLAFQNRFRQVGGGSFLPKPEPPNLIGL